MIERWLVKYAKVHLNQGAAYGKGGENHMRMNIGTSRKTLEKALSNMANAHEAGDTVHGALTPTSADHHRAGVHTGVAPVVVYCLMSRIVIYDFGSFGDVNPVHRPGPGTATARSSRRCSRCPPSSAESVDARGPGVRGRSAPTSTPTMRH